MPTLLLEWEESFGRPAPSWLTRFIDADGDRGPELVLFLAGASDSASPAARDSDDVLVEALAGLPIDGDLVAAFDRAALAIVTRADLPSSDADSAILAREATFRLLRVAAYVPERLVRLVADIHRRVATGEYLTLPTSRTQDVTAEALHVVARSQTDNEFVPLWWRLCELESAAPEHAAIGLLGLRWSPVAERDVARLLTEGVSRLALACVRASEEELLSESRSRRIFLSAVRTTARARKDLDWGKIGRDLVDATATTPAASLVARAFNVESRNGVSQSAVSSGPRYEDPGRAHALADALKVEAAGARLQAEAFLDHQRREAQRRGDALPLVQSLCNLAHSVNQNDPELAISWASEAASWQPHNEYTAVTWAEGLRASGKHLTAVELLLARLHWLAEHSAMWVETGTSLERLGDVVAGREALLEAVERFPTETHAWSALGEHFVRVGRLERAVETFEAGLRIDPRNRYLLPGFIRALALLGRSADAQEALRRAENSVGSDHPTVVRRRGELASGEFPVRKVPGPPPEWPSHLSTDALATLCLLLRRAGARHEGDNDDSAVARRAHESTVAQLQARAEFTLTASSELALSNKLSTNRAAPGSVHELLRVRTARMSEKGNNYTREAFDSLTYDGERSGASDQRMVPIRELSRLRAVATLVDGTSLEQHAIDAIGALQRLEATTAWQPSSTEDKGPLTVGQRRSAWAASALRTMRSTPGNGAIADLRRDLTEKSHQLDAIEEDAVIGLVR